MPSRLVAGYVLAGGKSSRMGQDKAMLQFGGQTLLRRAVTTMQAVSGKVGVVGDRKELEGADRAIRDRTQGCGPLGGMEAALNDLVNSDTLSEYEWACFLPVDMPLLPPGLYRSLIRHWVETATDRLRIAYVVADGAPQPLVSLLHRSMLQDLTYALQQGRYKVTSVFHQSSHVVDVDTRQHLDMDRGQNEVIKITRVNRFSIHDPCDSRAIQWSPTPAEQSNRDRWFSNINTPEQLQDIDIHPINRDL